VHDAGIRNCASKCYLYVFFLNIVLCGINKRRSIIIIIIITFM